MRSDTQAVPAWPLSYRLRLALEFAGVTPQEMAEELGQHINSVHNYVGGRRQPSRSVLRVWAMRCGVSFDWLVGDTGGVTSEETVARYAYDVPMLELCAA